MAEYIILGAGLSGLSAAYHLNKKGCQDWSIIEKYERVGGLCRSEQYDGFTFDHSIHILFSSDPYATDLIKALLHGNMVIQNRESWVYSHDVYTPFPWQANTYGLPIDVVKECLLGVIKATYEKKTKLNSLNFEEWCYGTFGEGLAKYFMIPYNRKLWAIDPKDMTDAWIKDRVMTPSLSEVIEGSLHRQKKNFGPNAVFWYPERGGIESLPLGFLNYLDKKQIFLNTEVKKILWKRRKIITTGKREWSYKRLITSLPLPILVKIMEPEVFPQIRESAFNLEHNTVYAINFAIRKEDLSQYHWVYFPEERFIFHRISFPKNFSVSMVPEGWSSIVVEISASKYKQVETGDNLIKRTISDLKLARVLNNKDKVELKSILTLNPAYIIYNHTHRSDVDKILQFLRENDVFSCGRFGEWEYFNMDHSIMSGKKAVE